MILLVEDNESISKALKYSLEEKNYGVKVAESVKDFKSIFNDSFELIILDVSFPDGNGFDLYDEYIKEKNIPTIFLTARDSEEDIVKGLDLGADDYLTKPFHMEELLARVNVQLRKNQNTSVDIMELGDIVLNLKSMELCNKNEDHKVKIIGKEFQLLELLINNANRVMEKEQLFVKIWGYDTDCDINTLEAYISFIRKKLKLVKSKINLKAIRNMGYVLEVDDEKIKN